MDFNSNNVERDFGALLTGAGPAQFAEVAKLLRGAPEELDTSRHWQILLEGWARVEPAAAFAEGLRNTRSEIGAQIAMSVWTAYDLPGAISYVQSVADLPTRQYQTLFLAEALYRKEPANAMAVAAGLPDTAMRAAAAGHMVTAASRNFARPEMKILADWISDHSSDPAFSGAARRLVALWVDESPEGAAAWARSLPFGEVRSAALLDLVGNWAGADPDAVGKWLSQQPRTPEWDASLESLARLIATANPDAAARWAASIVDPALRWRTQQEIVR